MHKTKCPQCGGVWQAISPRAVYCSVLCRVQAHRKRKEEAAEASRKKNLARQARRKAVRNGS